jgi:hypothetical protein
MSKFRSTKPSLALQPICGVYLLAEAISRASDPIAAEAIKAFRPSTKLWFAGRAAKSSSAISANSFGLDRALSGRVCADSEVVNCTAEPGSAFAEADRALTKSILSTRLSGSKVMRCPASQLARSLPWGNDRKRPPVCCD